MNPPAFSERVLSWLSATLAFLATVLVGIGEGRALFPLLMLLAAVGSVVFTDTLRWFRLNQHVSYALMILATLISLGDFLSRGSIEQLLSIANMLVLVQALLLFQAKDVRVHRNLLVVSALQVVVASLLNVGVMFGVTLVLYTVVGYFTLAVLVVRQYELRLRPAGDGGMVDRPEPAVPPGQTIWERLRGGPSEWRPAAMGLGQRPVLAGGFTKLMGGLGLAAILITAVFFYAIPRSEAVWQSFGQRRAVVGFSDEIRLNEVGKIHEQNEKVMRVAFIDPATGEHLLLLRDPYFRGAVTRHYISDERGGRWTRMPPVEPRDLPPLPTGMPWVKQDVVLAPTSLPILFSTSPAYRLPETPYFVKADNRRGLCFRTDQRPETTGGTFPLVHYTVGVTAFRNGAPRPITPFGSPTLRPLGSPASRQLVLGRRSSRAEPSGELSREEIDDLLRWDETRLQPLQDLAREVLERAGAANSDTARRAFALEDYLRHSGGYAYTLDYTGVPRRRDLDPIVDFAVNHRMGHCEYFASALTLMLRTQRIPARVVLGFKGGEFNNVGEFYQVRSQDAHAWVEAYLEPDEVKQHDLPESAWFQGGAWLRLDPTPTSGGLRNSDDSGGVLRRVDEWLDFAQWLWSDYVVGLGSDRQREYQPSAIAAADNVSRVFHVSTWREFFAKWRHWLDAEQASWFRWRAGLAAMVGAAVVILLLRGARRLGGRIAKTRNVAAKAARRRSVSPTVDFYVRLERLLGRLDLRRTAGQTQREFVLATAGKLTAFSRSGTNHVPPPVPAPFASAEQLLGEIADAFYRVRFGQCVLEPAEHARLEQALSWLGRVVESPRTSS